MALGSQTAATLRVHRAYSTALFATLLSALTLIILVHRVTGHHPHSGLFTLHEGFAALLFVLLLLIRFKFTGEYRPRKNKSFGIHAWLTYVASACFLISWPIGVYLLWTDL